MQSRFSSIHSPWDQKTATSVTASFAKEGLLGRPGDGGHGLPVAGGGHEVGGVIPFGEFDGVGFADVGRASAGSEDGDASEAKDDFAGAFHFHFSCRLNTSADLRAT